MTKENPDLCARGVHGMVGDNVGYNGEGRRFCRACSNERRKVRRRKARKARDGLCRRCGANLRNPVNVVEDAKGRHCRACREAANERRRQRRAEERELQETYDAMPRVAPAGVDGSGPLRGEAAALYRLQVMVRQGRGLLPTAGRPVRVDRDRGGGRPRP